MPSKKKKYNARFPPARIKKIMQTDEDVGKVAAAVPIIISKALEMFMESLIMKACENTQARHAKTMTTSHLKKCILQESNFDFLKDLVENVPDLPANEEEPPETKEPKSRKRRTVPSEGRERKNPGRKRKKKESEESDDEPESEDDEESSESHSHTGSASNPETASTSRQLPCPSTSEQDEVFEPQPSHPPAVPVSIPKLQIPTLFNSMNNQEDDDYDT